MSQRIYRWLLWILPRSFRTEYGNEMGTVFADRYRNAGLFERIVLWFEALPDILLTAFREHVSILRQDTRYALRAFRRAPGYALIALVTVALGVGANTAIFTVVDHALVRPLPYRDADRLVMVWETTQAYDEVEPSPGNFVDLRERTIAFADLAAYTSALATRNLTGNGAPERLTGRQITSNLLPMLGVTPALGRGFTLADQDVDRPAVVLISHGLWQRRLGGRSDVVGSDLQLSGAPVQVVGVMPPGFHFPEPDIDIWLPLRLDAETWAYRADNFLRVLGRLADEASQEQAQAEMTVIAGQLAEAYPETNEGGGIRLRSLREEATWAARTPLLLLSAASIGVLLIGCANLANLLLARASARRKELAVRSVLGAGRERLVRQILTENVLLSAVGGLVGVGLAYAALPLLGYMLPTNMPISTLAIDLRVILFAVALSLITGAIFAIYPAWQITRTSGAGLREGEREGVGGRKGRVRDALVIAEVAVSVVLLVGAGLLIQALLRVSGTDPGFRTENILTMRMSLPLPKYTELTDRQRFYDEVLPQIRALPGVKQAGSTGFLPFVMRGILWPVAVDGEVAEGDRVPIAVFREVTEGYLETMGISLLKGRHFDSSDTAESPHNAIVSQSFAERFWPGRDPLGQTFRYAVGWMPGDWTVVGVVADVNARGLERSRMPQTYILHRQAPPRMSVHAPQDLAIHHDGDPAALMPDVRRIVERADPELPISQVQTMAELFAGETATRRHQLRLLTAFAALAFLMAALGIHGVLSYLVSQRTNEIGVRMALGARTVDILALVLRRGIVLSLIGIVIGLFGGFALGNTMRSVLFGVEPYDLQVYVAAILLCLLASTTTCYFPAWRAARVDPLKAVRAE